MNKINLDEKIDIKTLIEVGNFTKKLREEVLKIVKKDISIKEICNFLEKRIFDNGFFPPFPAMVVLNEDAAHFTPYFEDDIFLKKGDVVNIDFGVCKDGWICDNSITIEIETTNHKKLLDTNKNILDGILDKIEVGMTMSEIGEIVEKKCKENNFNPICNLSGHRIYRNLLHGNLNPPNYKNNDFSKVPDNCILAIEPFITYGDNKVKNQGNSNILKLNSTLGVRDPYAKKVLNHIEKNFSNLPFSKRWLVGNVIKELNPNLDGFDKKKVDYAINILKRNKNITEYELLTSNNGKIVSQFEHTLAFFEGKKYILTK